MYPKSWKSNANRVLLNFWAFFKSLEKALESVGNVLSKELKTTMKIGDNLKVSKVLECSLSCEVDCKVKIIKGEF